MAKKAILFDFWGTLIENGVRPSPSKQVQYFLRLRMPFGAFVTRFEDVFMTKQYESLREGFEAVTADFKKRVPEFVYDKMVGMWNKFSILSKPFPETAEVLEDLKKDYQLILLSNSDNFSLRQVMDKFDLEKYFDKIYISCETGKLKHNPESYKQVLEENNLTPEDVLMVGDSPASDIKSAEVAGVPAVLIDRRGWCEDENMPKISDLTQLRGFIEDKS